MSADGDPNEVLNALESAEDGFQEVGFGLPEREERIDTDEDWKTQLTKGCRLLEVVNVITRQDGYYIATIELSFAAVERSLEAYALAVGGGELDDFMDHQAVYGVVANLGLLEPGTTERLENLWEFNRPQSYYGGRRPTDQQAEAMRTLAESIHSHVVNQIREGGICICSDVDQ